MEERTRFLELYVESVLIHDESIRGQNLRVSRDDQSSSVITVLEGESQKVFVKKAVKLEYNDSSTGTGTCFIVMTESSRFASDRIDKSDEGKVVGGFVYLEKRVCTLRDENDNVGAEILYSAVFNVLDGDKIRNTALESNLEHNQTNLHKLIEEELQAFDSGDTKRSNIPIRKANLMFEEAFDESETLLMASPSPGRRKILINAVPPSNRTVTEEPIRTFTPENLSERANESGRVSLKAQQATRQPIQWTKGKKPKALLIKEKSENEIGVTEELVPSVSLSAKPADAVTKTMDDSEAIIPSVENGKDKTEEKEPTHPSASVDAVRHLDSFVDALLEISETQISADSEPPQKDLQLSQKVSESSQPIEAVDDDDSSDLDFF